MNMIERVARAIDPMQFKGNEETYRYCIDCGDDHEFAKDTSDKTFPLEPAFEKARAALDAMKEPTTEMRLAGADAMRDHCGFNAPASSFWYTHAAMIAAAMGESDD
jgi:hypothetical protein